MVDQIPADVASAINTVMAGVRMLGRDGENRHQRYNFVSTDAFLAAVNPLCAAAGLIILQDEESVSIATTETADDYGKVKARTWLTARYSFVLAHKGGATWGPVRRSVMVQANGAQAFGSAQSYALKQFMRSLFQISTGEQDDADHQSADPLPPRQVANQQSAPAARPSQEPDEPRRPHLIAVAPDTKTGKPWWESFVKTVAAEVKRFPTAEYGAEFGEMHEETLRQLGAFEHPVMKDRTGEDVSGRQAAERLRGMIRDRIAELTPAQAAE